ncbi:hypothetical protein DFH06DRAFT_1423677 [Mycena polygramma]|nr:hypothetical protein DFH06DRAFT_1423677 [Mycena polygramma]
MSPIGTLPPELLADIFVRCIPISTRKLQSDLSWLNITRVSRLWRDVSIACPDFWSTLVLSRPAWVPIFLANSKSAALVIRVQLGKTFSVFQSLYPILTDPEHVSRLGTLEIRSPSIYLEELLRRVEHAGPAPRLRDVKIANTTKDPDDEGFLLPDDFLRREEVSMSGTGPGLALHLERCAFQWDSWWYMDLTHLHLENIALKQRPTMEELLNLLSDCPNLEKLAIIHCCPTTLDGFVVDLPRLSVLTIKTASSATCSALLHFLVIPSSATLSASCDVDPPHSDSDMIPFPLWSSHPSAYDIVRIILKDGLTYTLRDSTRPWWSRKFRVHGKAWAGTRPITWAMASVNAVIDFTHITTLHLQGIVTCAEGVSMWTVLRRGMPCIRTLHLHSGFPSGWLEFMFTHAMFLLGLTHFRYHRYGLMARNEENAVPLQAWPALRCLSLHGIDLGECGEQLHPSRSEILAALLWARREHGARICELEIEECENVFPQDLARFRLFADVVYDGKGETAVQKDDGCECYRAYSLDILARMIEHSPTIYVLPTPLSTDMAYLES